MGYAGYQRKDLIETSFPVCNPTKRALVFIDGRKGRDLLRQIQVAISSDYPCIYADREKPGENQQHLPESHVLVFRLQRFRSSVTVPRLVSSAYLYH
jgi:hypothetical protein